MSVEQVRLIRQALNDAHIYPNDLPDKAIHKLTYLVQKHADKQDVDLSIPYFWYRYGVLTQDPPFTSTATQGPTQPCLEPAIERIVDEAIDQYYETSLEDITDISYQDAPYQVFNEWRQLDKQLTTHHPDRKDFFDEPPTRQEIEETVEQVFDAFPVEEYPQHESDLLNWYFAITTELDMGVPDAERINDINTLFWGIFTLSVARNHHHNMTEQELLLSLGISSFEKEIEARRAEMRELERDSLSNRFEDQDSQLTEVTDALVTPLIDT